MEELKWHPWFVKSGTAFFGLSAAEAAEFPKLVSTISVPDVRNVDTKEGRRPTRMQKFHSMGW